MADNVTLPVTGTGTADVVQATDEISGIQYPKVKLIDGTADSTAAIPGSATDGLLVNLGTNNDVTVTGTVTVGSITAGDNNIGNVDVASIAAGTNLIGKVSIDQVTANANEVVVKSITAGDTNIGNVDIVTVPAPLNVVNNGAAATALRVTLANDSTGIVSLTTSTASIGKLAANSGIDIGDVDVASIVPGTGATNLGKAEDVAHNSGDVGVMALGVANTTHTARAANGDYVPIAVDLEGCVLVVGNVAHDATDADPPIKVGHKAIAHGTNPTAVAAGDRTDWYANRAGVPFVIGGHPNVVTLEAEYTAAQTDTAVVTIATGLKIVVTQIQAVVSNATTATPSIRVGFGTANTPTTTGVVLTHGGIPGGGGVSRGDGSGILGVGADNEDLRCTCTVPTGGNIRVLVTYYTIET